MTKLTDLTATTSIDDTDVFYVVDVGADTSYKFVRQYLFGQNLTTMSNVTFAQVITGDITAVADNVNIQPPDGYAVNVGLAYANSYFYVVDDAIGEVISVIGDSTNTGRLKFYGTSVTSANITYLADMNQSVATTASPTFANITDSAMTAGSVLFSGTAGIISQDNDQFYWDNVNKSLSLRAQENQMTINGSTYGSVFAVHSSTNTDAEIELHRHSDTAAYGSIIYGARSRGTEGAETIVQNGDTLFTIGVVGFDGIDYALGARIDFVVDGAPGTNDMPTSIAFKVSADGSQTPATAMYIDTTTYVGFNTTTPSTQVEVNGVVRSTGLTVNRALSAYYLMIANSSSTPLLYIDSSGNNPIYYLGSSSASSNTFRFITSATGSVTIAFNNNTSDTASINYNQNTSILTAGTSKFYVTKGSSDIVALIYAQTAGYQASLQVSGNYTGPYSGILNIINAYSHSAQRGTGLSITTIDSDDGAGVYRNWAIGFTYNGSKSLGFGFSTANADVTALASPLIYFGSTGAIGIGVDPTYLFDVVGGSTSQILLASNVTNNTAKYAGINMRQYANANTPFPLILGASTSTANTVSVGGGSSAYNAATKINLYAAANQTTTTGTCVANITTTGIAIGNGTTASVSPLDVIGSDGTYNQLRIGDSVTASISKGCGISGYHYDGTHLVQLMYAGNTSTANEIAIGGGTNHYAATKLVFYSASSYNTSIGTPGGAMDSSQNWIFGSSTTVAGTKVAVQSDTSSYYTQYILGTMASKDGSNNQAGLFLNNIMNPTSGSAQSAQVWVAPSFKASSATTIILAYGIFVNNGFSANVGTITDAFGIFIGAGGAASGTVAAHYGLYVQAPISGTNKYCAYFDAGVGIGVVNTGATYPLSVVGPAGLSTGTTWTNTSDKRIKKDIDDIENALDVINRLRPRSFRYTEKYLQEKKLKDNTYFGFIADEVEEVMPSCVFESPEKLMGFDNLKQLDVHNINIYLIKAVKELSDKINAIESKGSNNACR